MFTKSILPATAHTFLLAVLVVGSTSMGLPRTPAQDNPTPDNTKVNKTERDKGRPTAGDQKENSADRNTTQQIRRAVMKDKSLSSYAHNVKIITQDGMVTLKGPVRSEEEKQSIEAKAKQVADDDKVTDELEVKQ